MSQGAAADDRIHIEGLEVFVRIGVPDEERAAPQRLAISLTLWPAKLFSDCDDEIANTIDYAAVCEATKKMLSGGAHKLIETVADKIAMQLLHAFAVRRITVEVRKFILLGVDYVSVSVTRDAKR